MENFTLKPHDVMENVIQTYEKKANYPYLKSMILGLLAGMFIALGGFASTIASHSVENFGLAKFVAGSIFPIGLMLIILCGTDLFTGNILLVAPLLDKKITLKQVLINWIIIFFSNFVGAALISFLIYSTGNMEFNNFMLGGYALKVAATKGGLTFTKAFTSGILCNLLVCLAVWVSYTTKDMTGKILGIWFVIMTFIVSGFEHCVANMYYFSIALFCKGNPAFAEAMKLPPEKLAKIDIPHIINNLIPVTLGNIVGGAFVAAIFWIVLKNIKTK